MTTLLINTELEINDPEGREWEFVRIDNVGNGGEFYLNGNSPKLVFADAVLLENHSFIIRPLEPEVELETEILLDSERGVYAKFIELPDNCEFILLKMQMALTQKEARDLAKILNFWAEHGKLPTRIKVKEARDE